MKYVCLLCNHRFSKKSDGAWETCPKCEQLEAVWSGSAILQERIFIKYSPSWKKYESGMWNTDKKISMDYTDKFIDERDHAVKIDSKAKRWEEGRKKEWQKNKPAWAKKFAKENPNI